MENGPWKCLPHVWLLFRGFGGLSLANWGEIGQKLKRAHPLFDQTWPGHVLTNWCWYEHQLKSINHCSSVRLQQPLHVPRSPDHKATICKHFICWQFSAGLLLVSQLCPNGSWSLKIAPTLAVENPRKSGSKLSTPRRKALLLVKNFKDSVPIMGSQKFVQTPEVTLYEYNQWHHTSTMTSTVC